MPDTSTPDTTTFATPADLDGTWTPDDVWWFRDRHSTAHGLMSPLTDRDAAFFRSALPDMEILRRYRRGLDLRWVDYSAEGID